MKYLNKIVLVTILSFTLISFNEKEDLNLYEKSIIDIEDYGEFHNEAVLSILNNSSVNENLQDLTMMDLLREMESKMVKLHPEIFSNVDYSKINKVIDLDKKISDFKYDNKFYESLKKVGLENGAELNMVNYVDNMYYNNGELSDSFQSKNSVTNSNFQGQYEIFMSFYNSSEKLWTNEAPEDFLFKANYTSKTGCDPQSQVIVADAAVGFFGALLTGPGGVLLGGAASLLVRHQQIDNNGGCI